MLCCQMTTDMAVFKHLFEDQDQGFPVGKLLERCHATGQLQVETEEIASVA